MPEPSLRYVIVNVWRDTQSSRTEYIFGRNSRSEYRLSQTGPLRALIQNHQLHSQFHLDLDARVYTTLQLPEYRSPTSVTTRAPIHRPSGRTLHVHTETIDTGDRREMFRNTARRVIIRTSHRVTPEDDTRSGEAETECWYIDAPAAWRALHPPGRAISKQVPCEYQSFNNTQVRHNAQNRTLPSSNTVANKRGRSGCHKVKLQ